MIRNITIALFVFFIASCTDGVSFVSDDGVSADILVDMVQDASVDSYIADTLVEDTNVFDVNNDSSSEEDAFFFFDVWHKSPCGAGVPQCGQFNNFECPPSPDSCQVSACNISGCCVVGFEPGNTDCCQQDADCAQDETCYSGQCKKFTCPPEGLPGDCFEFSVPYRNVCFTKYLLSAVCTSQRPVECRHDTDCWDDSQCVENRCQQLNCLAGLDAGCYETDVSPFAASWRCVYDTVLDGTACDDGNACTTDSCHSGQCRGVGLASDCTSP